MEEEPTAFQECSFFCNQQAVFPHGSQMCTTACMQVGMAILCGQLDLCAAWRIGCERDGCTQLQQRSLNSCKVVGMLNWCMNASSTVHGRVEGILSRRDQGHHHHYLAHPRMISANELIRVLGIDMASLGVQFEEFVVCKQGLETRMCKRKDGVCNLSYESNSCYITLSHLPLCISMDSGSSIALVTANGHTVCAACYQVRQGVSAYAVFDPMPGQLWVGFSRAQLVGKVQSLLRIPASVRGGDVHVMEQGFNFQKKKKKNREADRNQQDSGNTNTADAMGNGLDETNIFYGDVTVMHLVPEGV